METKQSHSHVVHFIIFALAVFLFFKIVEPLITIFLASVIITYVSFPLYKRLRKLVPNNFLSIILAITVIALVLLLPFSYITFKITQQTFEFYKSFSGNIAKGALLAGKSKGLLDSQQHGD